jgi:putative hemolysin
MSIKKYCVIQGPYDKNMREKKKKELGLCHSPCYEWRVNNSSFDFGKFPDYPPVISLWQQAF